MKTLVAGDPEPVVDEHGNQRLDAAGKALFKLPVICIIDNEPSPLSIRISGDVAKLPLLTEIKLNKLVARPWNMGDRSGISFSVESIEIVNINKERAALVMRYGSQS